MSIVDGLITVFSRVQKKVPVRDPNISSDYYSLALIFSTNGFECSDELNDNALNYGANKLILVPSNSGVVFVV